MFMKDLVREGFRYDALQDSSLSNVSANTSLLCPCHYVLWVTRQSLGPNFGFNLARCFFTWKVVLSWSDSKGAAYNQFQHSLCTQVQFSALRHVRVGQTSLARLQHRLIVWNLRCKNSSEQRHLVAKSFFESYHSEILWDLAQWPKMTVTASWGVPHWRLQALINSYQTRAHFKRALRVQGPWCCVAGLLASFGLE